MTLLKRIPYEDKQMKINPYFGYDSGEFDFEVHSSQQFATVIFDRPEDKKSSLATVMYDRKINQFEVSNDYNPSVRRNSTCVYSREEWEGGKVIKICIIQHKGSTLLEIHSVPDEELQTLFGVENVNDIVYL